MLSFARLHRLPVIGGLAALLVALALTLWAGTGTAASDKGNDIWGASYFPNADLVDQDGKHHKFFDDLIKNKVVSVNFIFTSCAASCGLETARLKEVQQLLGDRVGKDVFFYSISIDPLNDTPKELKAYAAKFGAGPGWKFLTGKPADIELIQRKLGLFDDMDVGKGLNQHSLDSMIGNQGTGRWMKSSPFESPEVTAAQLGSWLHNYRQEDRRTDNDYANAPTRLRTMSSGESLFRSRCASCHAIGGARGGASGSARLLGPDLQGVLQRRQVAWVGRWIQEPDKMLAEKDPQAVALFAQYNQVLMPNMRLNKLEVDALLDFIAEESALPANAKRIVSR
jgi:cytochrome oxidase Cu insertion factor (SCO1/SenC/PrrC family)